MANTTLSRLDGGASAAAEVLIYLLVHLQCISATKCSCKDEMKSTGRRVSFESAEVFICNMLQEITLMKTNKTRVLSFTRTHTWTSTSACSSSRLVFSFSCCRLSNT